MEIKLLLVEDDPFLQDGLHEMLQREGYTADLAGNCTAANQYVTENSYRLILLDVSLPDGNGYELCANWRSQGICTPILFLTARDEEMEIVRGLDVGGDDYVTKPFRLQELLSRIRALLRRSPAAVFEQGELKIDLDNRTVFRKDNPVFLTPTEFQLLAVMVRNRSQIFTRAQLLQSIWDDAGVYIDDNTLSVHISRLREKIGGNTIRTVRGVGYQWRSEK
ncbi:MAG: response regulator transcription factor [Eubacteriales bacterium]|nr:response regulator transcription factor [Eubacteriales bacterium]